jgi:predicted MPP superfamily phosphohydrolase
MVNEPTIEEELPKINRDADLPTALAHHSPVGLQYAARGDIDLMPSGHTRGGQLFPGTLLAQIRFPLN